MPSKFHIKFAKYLLGVHKAEVCTAVLAEIGMWPIAIGAVKALVEFKCH